MQPIQISLQKRLNQHKLTPQAQAAMVVHFANEELSKKHDLPSSQACATQLKSHILWVEVTHPIVGQKVWGASMELLNSIHQKYPNIKVEKIRTKALTQG